jgi:single-strand DNA-binding protein
MVNKVILVGNVASDPEVRASQSGTYVTKMRFATNVYAGKSEDGTAKQHTDFHSLVFFGKTAETAGTHLHKGQLLYIEGQLRNSSWDDAASGQKRHKTEVVVDTFRFLGPKQQGQEAAA